MKISRIYLTSGILTGILCLLTPWLFRRLGSIFEGVFGLLVTLLAKINEVFSFILAVLVIYLILSFLIEWTAKRMGVRIRAR
jgi:hypothetical protein